MCSRTGCADQNASGSCVAPSSVPSSLASSRAAVRPRSRAVPPRRHHRVAVGQVDAQRVHRRALLAVVVQQRDRLQLAERRLAGRGDARRPRVAGVVGPDVQRRVRRIDPPRAASLMRGRRLGVAVNARRGPHRAPAAVGLAHRHPLGGFEDRGPRHRSAPPGDRLGGGVGAVQAAARVVCVGAPVCGNGFGQPVGHLVDVLARRDIDPLGAHAGRCEHVVAHTPHHRIAVVTADLHRPRRTRRQLDAIGHREVEVPAVAVHQRHAVRPDHPRRAHRRRGVGVGLGVG